MSAPHMDPPRLLLDPYGAWAEKEGVPVTEDFSVDLTTCATAPWSRFGVHGGIVNLKGRGDFVSIFVIELHPAAEMSPQQHLFEEVVYVLSGHGSTAIEAADGRKHIFEWGPKSLFVLPLNARYQHFNASGREPVRLASVNTFSVMLNLFRDERFIVDNGFRFPEREDAPRPFSGEADFVAIRPGRNVWETAFVPDLSAFDLKAWDAGPDGAATMTFVLGESAMHAQLSQSPAGYYRKAQRPRTDAHLFCVGDRGYSLMWHEGARDLVRVDWRHGVVFATPAGMYRQDFNTSPHPGRMLAVGLGGMRYPLTAARRHAFLGMEVGDAADEIYYAAQDPRIHATWLKEMADTGTTSQMSAFIDERPSKGSQD